MLGFQVSTQFRIIRKFKTVEFHFQHNTRVTYIHKKVKSFYYIGPKTPSSNKFSSKKLPGVMLIFFDNVSTGGQLEFESADFPQEVSDDVQSRQTSGRSQRRTVLAGGTAC